MQPGDHLSTFGGNPISCAAALANIAVLEEEKLVDNAQRQGELLLEPLSSACSSAAGGSATFAAGA